MAVYNKFKDNPNCVIYEVYHWEAHPSQYDDSHKFEEIPGDWMYQQPFTKPDGVEHRIIHHECYKEVYPDVTIPALIDDGPDGNNPKVSTGCLVSNQFKASYTSVYVIGLDSICLYTSHWPPGPNISIPIAKLWIDTTYKSLDSILTDIVQTPIIPVESFSTAPQKFIRIHTNGTVSLTMPEQIRYSVIIFDMTGKRISTKQGYGSSRYSLSGTVASGVYIVRLDTGEGTYISPVCVSHGSD